MSFAPGVMRNQIANFGLFLAFLGVFSAVVQIFGWEMRLLRPLANAPPLTAWGVRGGLVALGAIVFFLAHKAATPEERRQAEVDRSLMLQGLAQDPQMSHLLRYVHQSVGATLGAPTGAPRVAHLLFMGPRGYGSDKAGARGAIALVETPQGKRQAFYMFAENQLSISPCDDSTWASYMSF